MLDGVGNINDYVKQDMSVQKMADKYREKSEQINQFNKNKAKKTDYRMSGIMGKMRRGRKLSYSDLGYLRQKNPPAYAKAVVVQKKREDFEAKLKLCKDKEDVRRLRSEVTGAAVSGGSSINADSMSVGGSVNPAAAVSACSGAGSMNGVESANSTVKAAVTSYISNQTNIQQLQSIQNTYPQNNEDYGNEYDKTISSFSEKRDIDNYEYRSLGEAYRIFKNGLTYQKMPIKRRKPIINFNVNVKINCKV